MLRLFSRGSAPPLRGARAFSQLPRSVRVNGSEYRVPHAGSFLVGILLDGSSQDYIEAATIAGCMPNWNRILAKPSPFPSLVSEQPVELEIEQRRGEHGLVAAVMPTFTNPNNVAVITGTTPNVNGICGNYFYDTDRKAEVMMNSSEFLRCDTILGTLSRAGVPVTVITAKDKLRQLLCVGLDDNHSYGFSVERAGSPESQAVLNRHGVQINQLMDRPLPAIYDPDISVFALELCAKLIASYQNKAQQAAKSEASPVSLSSSPPRVFYVSTTDFVQHKNAPGTPLANAFYSSIDRQIGELHRLGAIVGLTADHGMNDKVKFDGSPAVVYLETVLRAIGISSRVILPITDPYVLHHGALGSYAGVHLLRSPDSEESAASIERRAIELLRGIPGIYTVLDRNEACRNFDLPPDRTADLVVISDQNTVVGRTPEWHDLSHVPHLRSHGGLSEITVPMFINRPLLSEFSARLTRGKARNFHLFDFLLNGLA